MSENGVYELIMYIYRNNYGVRFFIEKSWFFSSLHNLRKKVNVL
jgi:hypothetical protein